MKKVSEMTLKEKIGQLILPGFHSLEYDDQIRTELAHIYRTEYKGVNFSKFARDMEERGYIQSRSTIYNILRQKRIRSPQRKNAKKTSCSNE